MDKLAEIKAAIDKENAQNTPERAKFADHYGVANDVHREWINYLELLLPIVEAATALDFEWLQRAQHEMSYTNEAVEPLNRLEKIVDELKATK